MEQQGQIPQQSELYDVEPGSYCSLTANEFITISEKTIGLLVGERVTNDNHIVVLVNDHLILIPKH